VAKRRKVGNLLALALLALLVPGRPMHPYQMARILRRTGKEHDMKIKWGSLYTVVQNLEKHGFIEQSGSQREGRRPERTVYAITDAGRAEVRDWLRELVAEPEPELHRFEAALSVLGVLAPAEVIGLLERRLQAIEGSVARQREALKQSAQIPRIFLIEAEYALAMTQAEAAWVRELREELVNGSLSGFEQWRDYHQTGEVAGDWERLLEEE
jgi:DNA-binding PadR family transcriptional regulator